jgi:hypothetical protein
MAGENYGSDWAADRGLKAPGAIESVDIADIQIYNLGQPQPHPQHQRVDHVVLGIAANCGKERSLLSLNHGFGAEVGRCLTFAAVVPLTGNMSRKESKVDYADAGGGTSCAGVFSPTAWLGVAGAWLSLNLDNNVGLPIVLGFGPARSEGG